MNCVSKISLISFLLIFSFCFQAVADPQGPITKNPLKEQPELPEYLLDKKEKDFTLPPVPEMRKSAPVGPQFVIGKVLFEGNTVFPDSELNQVVAAFLNRRITMADLEEMRYRLTRKYVDQGYFNSGALIKPGQRIDGGVITYIILEGRLNDIRVKGNNRLRPEYIKKRIWPDPHAPFNAHLLQERFQMLLQDPLISRMNGKILPDTKPGDALLDLNVTREKPYELSISSNNHSPPSLGAEHLLLKGVVRNLTGFGDFIDLQVGLTEGIDEINADFSIPLNSRNTLFAIGYNRSENAVVEEPLEDFDVESQLESASISLTHPFYHSLKRKFDLSVTLDTQESKTYLLGFPFGFSEGYSDDGKSRVNSLRFIQSFEDRSLNHAWVLRSTISLGLDVFGATIHSDGRVDGEYVSWLGQFQYARRLGKGLGHVILKGNTQLADDKLFSMEQFSVGGISTVRGYRENQIVRDNGYVLSVEWRVPIWEGNTPQKESRQLQVAPFIDWGEGWNKHDASNGENLFSAGVGLLWASPRINAELYIAHGFEDVASQSEYDLQDDGIHFGVTVKLL